MNGSSEPPTERQWACLVYYYGGVFMDSYRSAGHDQAAATGDMALAARLQADELGGARP